MEYSKYDFEELEDMTRYIRGLSIDIEACGNAIICTIESLLERLMGGPTHLDQGPPEERKPVGDWFFETVEKTFAEYSIMVGVNPDLTRFRKCDKQLMQTTNDIVRNIISRYNKENKTNHNPKYIIVLEHAPKSHCHMLINAIPNDLLHYIDVGIRRKIGMTEIEYSSRPSLAIAYTLKLYREEYRLKFPKIRYLEALRPESIYYNL